MHDASSMKFSINLLLYKVVQWMFSSMACYVAELPAILDSFFTSTTSDYIGVVGWGWWGAMEWQGKHTLCSYTCIVDPLVLEMAQITTGPCETLQPSRLCSTASKDD